jgi:hypothetical protein
MIETSRLPGTNSIIHLCTKVSDATSNGVALLHWYPNTVSFITVSCLDLELFPAPVSCARSYTRLRATRLARPRDSISNQVRLVLFSLKEKRRCMTSLTLVSAFEHELGETFLLFCTSLISHTLSTHLPLTAASHF